MRECLQRLKVLFQPETQIGRYSIDFAIVDCKIAIEVDGTYWHNPTKDARRDNILAKYGWQTVRISEKEVNEAENLDGFVASRLKEVVCEIHKH